MYEYKYLEIHFSSNQQFDEQINFPMHDGWRIRNVNFGELLNNSIYSQYAQVVLERRVKSDGTYTNKNNKTNNKKTYDNRQQKQEISTNT